MGTPLNRISSTLYNIAHYCLAAMSRLFLLAPWTTLLILNSEVSSSSSTISHNTRALLPLGAHCGDYSECSSGICSGPSFGPDVGDDPYGERTCKTGPLPPNYWCSNSTQCSTKYCNYASNSYDQDRTCIPSPAGYKCKDGSLCLSGKSFTLINDLS